MKVQTTEVVWSCLLYCGPGPPYRVKSREGMSGQGGTPEEPRAASGSAIDPRPPVPRA